MNDRLKNLLPALPGAALLGLAGWLLCAPAAPLPFTARVLERERAGIAGLRAEREKLRAENRKLRQELLPLERMRSTAWSLPSEQVRVALAERLERAAAESGMTLRSMSDVQAAPAAKGIEAHTLNLSAGCTIAELEALLRNLSNGKPGFYWRSLRIRPSSPGTPELLQLDGQLAVLNFPVKKEDK